MYKHRNPYGYSNNEYHLLSLDNPEIFRDIDAEVDELPLFIGEELPAYAAWLSIQISRISEERIGKRDKGGSPPFGGYLRITPPGNAGRGFYEVSKVLPFQKASGNYAPEKVVSLEPQQF